MANRSDDYDGAWIQGGTARIAARGGPGGGPIEFDDTPPELKEHMKREENKDTWSFRSENLARLYGDHYTPFAEARKTMGLGDAKGFTERSLTVFDADVLATAKSAPSDEARQRFVDDAMDLRGALETRLATTEGTFNDMKRRSDLGLKAGALARQAQAYPEDYALHAAVLNKVADGAMPLVKRERAIQFRAVEAEKMARGAMMGFIEQGRFDEGRALLATATDADGNPGTLPLPPEAVKELSGLLEERHAEAAARETRLDRVDTVIEGTAGPTEDPTEDAARDARFLMESPRRGALRGGRTANGRARPRRAHRGRGRLRARPRPPAGAANAVASRRHAVRRARARSGGGAPHQDPCRPRPGANRGHPRGRTRPRRGHRRVRRTGSQARARRRVGGEEVGGGG